MGKHKEMCTEAGAMLANAISDAFHASSVASGLDVDEAACVAIAVIADYAREAYGDRYLIELADVLVDRANHPLPETKREPN